MIVPSHVAPLSVLLDWRFTIIGTAQEVLAKQGFKNVPEAEGWVHVRSPWGIEFLAFDNRKESLAKSVAGWKKRVEEAFFDSLAVAEAQGALAFQSSRILQHVSPFGDGCSYGEIEEKEDRRKKNKFNNCGRKSRKRISAKRPTRTRSQKQTI